MPATRIAATLLLVFAAEFAASAAEGVSAPHVGVLLVDGARFEGRISRVENQSLALDAVNQQAPLAIEDVVAIDVERHPGDARPTADRWILLAGGDRAPLSPVDLVDDVLVGRWPGGTDRAHWRVPLQYVRGLLFQRLDMRNGRSRVPELSFREFSEDTLILRDGTRLTGVLDDVSPDTLKMETAVGAVSVETARIDAVALDSALVRMPDHHDSLAVVVTNDGAWLTLHEWSIGESGELTGRTGIDTEYHCRLDEVQCIRCYGPRVVDLTMRTPVETLVTPFVSRTAKPLVNRNVRGGFLRIDGREYPRGLGMTSGMSVTFPLEPEDRQFRATIGLDDLVGDAGSVVFAVDLDGRRIFSSPILRGSDAAVVVGPLEIAGGERLTLSVEFAEYGNVQDVADWCETIVLR